MLQRLRVGVLAGLHKVVQVEVARDERGGLAVRLVQGQRLVPLQVAQAFRSQLPQDAAEYVRLNVGHSRSRRRR